MSEMLKYVEVMLFESLKSFQSEKSVETWVCLNVNFRQWIGSES